MDYCSLRSAIDGTVWPTIPTPLSAACLAVQYQLQQSERWPPEALRRAQFRQLGNVLSHAVTTVPYYRDRLGKARIDLTRLDDPDIWGKIPLLTRRDIQVAGEALHSTAVPSGHGESSALTTSGSTGAPVTIRGTALTQFFKTALTLRHYLWHNFDFRLKHAAIRYASGGGGQYPKGEQYPTWGGGMGSVMVTGPSVFLNIDAHVAQQLEWLEREQPSYLLTYPSNLMALLTQSRRDKRTVSTLQAVQTLGEILFAETRQLCREVWGVEIVDMYGTQEAGYVALQCPGHAHYHVQSESLLVEVIDKNGNPCQPGQTGRIVLSTLHNFAMPLIRYSVGDFATVGDACSCGRGLPVLSRIMGRVRNMMTLPTGEQFWPNFGGEQLPTLAPIRQYQLVQKSVAALELRAIVDRPLSPNEEENVRNHINRKLGADFAISFSYRESLPRGPGGKFEDFHCEIGQ